MIEFSLFPNPGDTIFRIDKNNLPDDRIINKEPFYLRTIRRDNPDDIGSDIWLNQEFRNENETEERNSNGEIEIDGWQEVGAQIHFYMEPNISIAIPDEDEELTIYSSSQHLTSIQNCVHDLLNRSSNKIIVKTKRLGGGFGGKELRPRYYAGAAAVAVFKLKKPVRLALDRETDSIMTGTRHTVVGKYRVYGDNSGKISRYKIQFNSDAGSSWDCSAPVMELILLSADSVYKIPAFRADGNIFLTNIQSRTAFRSFGLIQATIIIEDAIEKYAHIINKRQDEVRKINFYRDAVIDEYDYTPYGQPLPYMRIGQVWEDLKETAKFNDRYKKVLEFNENNKWKKRGISIIPIKYGISYTFRPMNFGNAYVFVYGEDGTVLIHHGGVEMGQGIHTKIIQIAAKCLAIDHSRLRIDESATDKIPNASSTGASTGSDLNGAAVLQACTELRNRLVKFLSNPTPPLNTPERGCFDDCMKESSFNYIVSNISHADFSNSKWCENWNAAWKSIVTFANISRENLSAEGFYRSKGFGVIDPVTGKFNEGAEKRIFYYFTYSAAISEVEIDLLTGEFNIIQTDIAYDAGVSLNSKIDYGQIEGGFIQGVGYVTTENVYYDKDGKLITTNTWDYKLPCTKTIPEKFNVYILNYVPKGDRKYAPLETYGIQSSKSTGEPPLVLASSVFFAIKSAIMAARADRGRTDYIHIDCPLTVQKIFMYSNCLENSEAQ